MNNNNNDFLENTLKGILHFFFETGTEGGDWAFQDSGYIQENIPRGYCKNCGIYLREQSGALKIQRVTPIDEEFLRELQLTGKITERPDCSNNDHEEEIGDLWDYQGLHILENGDNLTIYDCSGFVRNKFLII